VIDRRGNLICEIDLFCCSFPLQRGRSYSNTVQSLENQHEVIERLTPFAGMNISCEVIIEVEYYYKNIDGIVNYYDIDNLLKATFDNLQRRNVIVNDNQIKGVNSIILKGSENHTTIRIFKIKGVVCSYFGHIKKMLRKQ
jgi:Holliday junction resolvase RusA-like endonuclease